jgi:hypothetical protein
MSNLPVLENTLITSVKQMVIDQYTVYQFDIGLGLWKRERKDIEILQNLLLLRKVCCTYCFQTVYH